MTSIAIIGGSGLTRLKELGIKRREIVHTPFGEASAPLLHGEFRGRNLVFLPRHGPTHNIPPHKVNYRANLWALKSIGVKQVLSVAAVGGITEGMGPGTIVIPDQIIDYTYSRDHTFFEHDLTHVTHIDFTQPYCEAMRVQIREAAQKAGIGLRYAGTYGATQGPRLESAMEIRRLERDGCDIVGMTGMPETALARELDLCYACCAVVANWAAGKSSGPITMEKIEKSLVEGMGKIREIIGNLDPIQ